MVGNHREAHHDTTRALTLELGAIFAIAVALRTGKSVRNPMHRRASWMPLDLRRRRSVMTRRRALLDGLPFGIGRPRVFAIWKTIRARSQESAATARQIPLPTAAAANASGKEPIHPRVGAHFWLGRPPVRPKTFGFTFTSRGLGAALGLLKRHVPVAPGEHLPHAARARVRRQERLPFLASAQQIDQPEFGSQIPPRERSGDAVAPGGLLASAADGSGSGEPIVSRVSVRQRRLDQSTIAAGAASPRWSGRAEPIWARPRLRSIVGPARVADSVAAEPNNKARSPALTEHQLAAAAYQQEPLDWASTIAPPTLPPVFVVGAARRGRDPSSTEVAGEQSGHKLVARKQFTDALAQASALAALSGPALQQLIIREVTKQVASVKAPSSPLPAPPPSKAPVLDLNFSSDDVVRRLLSKMRAISREERFRGGLIR